MTIHYEIVSQRKVWSYYPRLTKVLLLVQFKLGLEFLGLRWSTSMSANAFSATMRDGLVAGPNLYQKLSDKRQVERRALESKLGSLDDAELPAADRKELRVEIEAEIGRIDQSLSKLAEHTERFDRLDRMSDVDVMADNAAETHRDPLMEHPRVREHHKEMLQRRAIDEKGYENLSRDPEYQDDFYDELRRRPAIREALVGAHSGRRVVPAKPGLDYYDHRRDRGGQYEGSYGIWEKD